MISDEANAYVWVWLPEKPDPVVAGRLDLVDDSITFTYGRKYLGRSDAISLYLPELPLKTGEQKPPDGMSIAGCIDDASPDAWGRRVIEHSFYSAHKANSDATLNAITYLLMSGSDRIGALDFQNSATNYIGRSIEENITLEDLIEAADYVDRKNVLPQSLATALLHGSSIGGARPKAMISVNDNKMIAKFSSATDPYPVVQGEYVAMKLAKKCGIDTAEVQHKVMLKKHVLLVKRFDRTRSELGWTRESIVSALTILGLSEMLGRYATYHDLAQIILTRFSNPKETLTQLFKRISFNILVGNTDDHARNHAAFWNGYELTLTPAYDICPQIRVGREANQAMAYGENLRKSRLSDLVLASRYYLLDRKHAQEIIDDQIQTINSEWKDTCDEAELTEFERNSFWGNQFLNDYALGK